MRLAPAILASLLSFGLLTPGLAAPQEPNLPEKAFTEPIDDTPPLHAEPPVPFSGLLARAEVLLDEGGGARSKEASHLLGLALKIDPGSGLAHALLARADAATYSSRYVEDDSLIDTAVAEGRRAVELMPDDAQAHAALAVGLIAGEDWDSGFHEAERGWKLKSDTTPPWVTGVYVQTLIARAETDAALKILEDALAKWPGQPRFYALKGAALMEAGKRDDAVEELQRALLLDRDMTPALVLLARALDESGRLTVAGALYKEVVDRFPEEKARVYTLMSSTLISRHKYKEALSGLEQIKFGTRRGLGEGTRIYLMAACHEGMGKDADAIEEYRKVIDNYPLASYGSYSAESLASASYEGIARIEMRGGKLDEASKTMEEAMSRPKPNVTLFLRLAGLYEHYGLGKDELAVLRRADATDFGPRQVGPKVAIYVAWARALKNSKDEDPAARKDLLEALDRYEKALVPTAEIPYFLEAARACALAGAPEKGLAWLKRAVDLGYSKLEWIHGDADMAGISRLPGFAELKAPSP